MLTKYLSLLLVEDNPLFHDQIRGAALHAGGKWRLEIVGSGREALDLLQPPARRFDLVLVDIGLPDISGIEVIAAWHARFPELPIVVVSMIAAELTVIKAIQAGAKGYILKGESVDAIAASVSQIMEGIYPLSPSLARYLFKRLSVEQEKGHLSPNQEFKLTPRELETLRFLAKGLTYEGVADQMGVALSTIQWNVRNLYRKLNVRSQVQAVTKARDFDLL